MAGIENQTVPMCEQIHGTLHIRVDKQEKRADRQDETIDKVRNRLPGYAVIVLNVLVAFTSILATLLTIVLTIGLGS